MSCSSATSITEVGNRLGMDHIVNPGGNCWTSAQSLIRLANIQLTLGCKHVAFSQHLRPASAGPRGSPPRKGRACCAWLPSLSLLLLLLLLRSLDPPRHHTLLVSEFPKQGPQVCLVRLSFSLCFVLAAVNENIYRPKAKCQ